MSLLLYGNNSFIEELRVLTSIELFLNAEFYCNHPSFSLSESRPVSFFFNMSLKNSTIDSDLKGEEAGRFDALSNCKDREWSSFLCILGLSSVVKKKIFSHFPDCGEVLQKLLRNQVILPRIQENISADPFHILFCKLGGLTLHQPNSFQSDHFEPLIKFYKTKKRKLSTIEIGNDKNCKKNKLTVVKTLVNNGKSTKFGKNSSSTSCSNKGVTKKCVTESKKISFFFSKENSLPKVSLTTSNVMNLLEVPPTVSLKFQKSNVSYTSVCSTKGSLNTLPSSSLYISPGTSFKDEVSNKIISTSNAVANTFSTFSNSKNKCLISLISSPKSPYSNTLSTNSSCNFSISKCSSSENIVGFDKEESEVPTINGKNDVSSYKKFIHQKLSDEEKYNLYRNVFVPNKDYIFPKTNRLFLYKWLRMFPWLSYSPAEDGAYCLPCLLFGGDEETTIRKLLYEPVTHWPAAVSSFKKHINAVKGVHSACMPKFYTMLSHMKGKSLPVNVSMNKVAREKIANNRKNLLSIIDAIKLCGRLGIALRGHRDSSKYHPAPSEIPDKPGVGNFVQIINYAIRNGNKVLENHLKSCSKRETYISAKTQNDLLKCCYDYMTENILKEIKKAVFYALILDEARDVSNRCQLSFCIRFVDESFEVREEFLKFVSCDEGVTGEDLFEVVEATLIEFGLDIMNIRGQGYDGAGAMAGKTNGLSGRILKVNFKALLTHCFSHRLNLVICSLTLHIGFRNTMDAIQSITYFFNFSTIRGGYLSDLIEADFPQLTKKKPIDPCKTRWVEKIEGVDFFQDAYIAIVTALEHMSVNFKGKFNSDTISKASNLLKLILNFDFIVKLVISRHILDFTSSVTKLLQSKSIDIIKGLDLIKTLLSVFVLARNNVDDYHNEWYAKAIELANIKHVSEVKPRVCKIMTHKENYPSDTISDFYKRSFTIPLLEEVYGQLKRRFEGNNLKVFNGLYVIPNVMMAVVNRPEDPDWKSHFKSFLEFYSDDFDDSSLGSIDAELTLWEEYWTQYTGNLPDTVTSTLKAIDFPCFDTIKVALRILGTIPVTSCSCERSFSALRMLKTYNRSTMCNERLNALALMFIHKNVDPDPEDILDRFIALGPHRLQLDL